MAGPAAPGNDPIAATPSATGSAARTGADATGGFDPRRHAGVLVASFGLALVVRIGAFLRTAVIFNDGPVFLSIAEQMSAGRWDEALSAFQHPGYPWLIAALRPAVGDFFDAAIVVSLVFGSLAVVALYAFLVQAWDRRVAAFGALMLAVNPYAARFSGDVQSEPVYLFFFLAAVAVSFAGLRRRAVGLAGVAGVLTGLAYLTRPEGVGVAVASAAMAGVAWLRGGWSWRRTGAWLTALCAGAGIVMAPYLLAVREASGGFRLSQKKSLLTLLGIEPGDVDGVASAVGGAPDPRTMEVVAFVLAAAAVVAGASVLKRLRGTAVVRVRIGSVALAGGLIALAVLGAATAPNSFGVFSAAVISTMRPEIAALMLVGVLAGVRRGPSGRTLFVTLLVGLYAVVLFGLLLGYGYLSRRHVLPPLTLLFGYAAAGAWVLVDALEERLHARGVTTGRASTIAVVAIAGLLVAISLPKAWHDHRREEMPARSSAEWVRENTVGDGMIASNRMKHGWYAGREWRPLRHEGALMSLEHLRVHGVRWLLLEQDLLDPLGRPVETLRTQQSVRLVERFRVEEGERVAVIFEVEAREP